jgi:uncharacterized phage infection (PIP) family protein YhgE
MIESAIISAVSALSGCALSFFLRRPETLRLQKELSSLVADHNKTLIELHAAHADEKCKIRLECQEANEQHLLANQELRLLNNKAQQAINELQDELHDTQIKSDRYRSSLNELASDYNKLATEVQQLRNENENLEQGLQTLQSNLEEVQAECEQVKQNYVAMANRGNEEIGKLQTMLKNYHQALEQTAKQNQQLQSLTNGAIK